MNTLKRRILTGSLITVLLTLATLSIVTGSRPEVTANYTEVEVMRGDMSEIVSATGTLNPVNTVQVGSQVSGSIAGLHADFNDRVDKGEVIARIDPAVYRARVAEAEASLKSAEADAEKARVGVRDAERELARQSNLFEKQLVAENVRDAALFAHDSAKVELQARLAAVAQAEAALQREQVNLAYTTIYAPIDGVVISRDVDVGQTVAASLQAPTLFTIAQDLTQMQVEAEVDEAFIGKVRPGQAVQFSVFAYPGRKFIGKVAQVRLQPKVESGVVRYNSIIHVDNPDLLLKPGMTATVSILVAEQRDVLKVPTSALRFVPDWPDKALAEVRASLQPGQRIVWTPEGDRLRPIVVSSGIDSGQQVAISGDGLHEGMKVLVPDKGVVERKQRFGLSLF
jgi:HlyD family secretion protein